MSARWRPASLIPALALVALTVLPESLTTRHAAAQGADDAPGGVADGQVVGTTADALLTSITRDRLGDVQNHERLTVRVADRALTARFFDAARYTALRASPAAREGLDVDVVCTVDAGGAIVIVGLGGGLTDWLGARPGMRVVVEMP